MKRKVFLNQRLRASRGEIEGSELCVESKNWFLFAGFVGRRRRRCFSSQLNAIKCLIWALSSPLDVRSRARWRRPTMKEKFISRPTQKGDNLSSGKRVTVRSSRIADSSTFDSAPLSTSYRTKCVNSKRHVNVSQHASNAFPTFVDFFVSFDFGCCCRLCKK